jgi:hypothetical protein
MRVHVRDQVASLQFGPSASLVYGDVAAFKRDTFSMSAWVKLGVIGASTVAYLFTAFSTHYYWALLDSTGTNQDSAAFFLRAVNAAAGAIIGSTSITTERHMRRGVWSFLSVTVETVGQDVYIIHYLNGSQVRSASWNAGWSGTYGSNFQTLGSASSILTINNLMYSSSVWTPVVLSRLMKGDMSPANAPGIISHWPMHEGAGSAVQDVVGGHTGAFGGTAPTWSGDVPVQMRRQL